MSVISLSISLSFLIFKTMETMSELLLDWTMLVKRLLMILYASIAVIGNSRIFGSTMRYSEKLNILLERSPLMSFIQSDLDSIYDF